ncbi:MAG: HAMP domain-containing histidine kinase, partial [Clostridia bacterium]|nr:HAMP domain-containing histidine kinase [Clostridia bacterium]
AARIKTRTLFKNTIIYRIFAWLGRLFNMMGMNLKAAFIFLGYLLLNAIGAAYLFNSRYGGFAFVMLAFFNCAVLYGILECISQMKKLKEAATAIAEGNLSYETDTSKLKWEFKEHGESLNSVGRGMARAVNERMRSERFKTELITNVSHDLKTPLTSIVTYIDLLQKEEIPGEQAKEYVDTIARQSAKLKKLTEDLIEASKASSGVMSVNLERVNVSELLRQSTAEYGERMAAAGIATVMTLPEDDIYITADGRLLWRVMDNLLLNICRHGMNGTRAYIGAEKREENTVISFKNISSKELNISPEELLERFVQGDESRNTEGSGLGLSIAQSLTELMKGKMQLYLDGDLFKVELIFSKDEM